MEVRHRNRRLLGRRVLGDSGDAAERMHRELKNKRQKQRKKNNSNQKEGSEEDDGGDKQMAAEVKVTSSDSVGGFIDPNC